MGKYHMQTSAKPHIDINIESEICRRQDSA